MLSVFQIAVFKLISQTGQDMSDTPMSALVQIPCYLFNNADLHILVFKSKIPLDEL